MDVDIFMEPMIFKALVIVVKAISVISILFTAEIIISTITTVVEEVVMTSIVVPASIDITEVQYFDFVDIVQC